MQRVGITHAHKSHRAWRLGGKSRYAEQLASIGIMRHLGSLADIEIKCMLSGVVNTRPIERAPPEAEGIPASPSREMQGGELRV